jgi:hypothetical protein
MRRKFEDTIATLNSFALFKYRLKNDLPRGINHGKPLDLRGLLLARRLALEPL